MLFLNQPLNVTAKRSNCQHCLCYSVSQSLTLTLQGFKASFKVFTKRHFLITQKGNSICHITFTDQSAWVLNVAAAVCWLWDNVWRVSVFSSCYWFIGTVFISEMHNSICSTTHCAVILLFSWLKLCSLVCLEDWKVAALLYVKVFSFFS